MSEEKHEAADSMAGRPREAMPPKCLVPGPGRAALCMLVLATLCAAGQDPGGAWLDPNAFGRLMVSLGPERAHQVLVLIPSPWDKRANGLSAFAAGGETLYATPITCNGTMPAAEISVPRSKKAAAQKGLSVTLYLNESGTTPRPIPENYRRPVCLQRVPAVLTTRPFTFAEMDRLSGRYAGRPLYNVGVDALGAVLNRAAWQTPPQRRTAVMRWRGSILLAEEQTVRFGADQDAVAWFVAVNGNPAAEWRHGTPRKGGGRFGNPIRLRPGLHAIVFQVAQRHGEPIPVCLWRTDDGPPQGEPLPEIYPGVIATGWAVQLKGETNMVGAMVSEWERLTFVGENVDLMRMQTTPVPAKPAPEVTCAFRLDGHQLTAEAGVLLTSRVAFPEILINAPKPLGTLRTPQYNWFPRPVLTQAQLRLGSMQPIAPHGGNIELTCHLEWPETMPEDVRQRIALMANQLDADNAVLEKKPLIQTDRYQSATASVSLHPQTVRLACRAMFQDRDLIAPVHLRIVRPADDAAARVAIRGRSAYVDTQRAVMVCNPLPANPFAAPLTLPDRRGLPTRVILYDDFCAVSSSPDAEVLPEEIVNRLLGNAQHVRRLSVSAGAFPGMPSEYMSLAALGTLLRMDPDSVVLLIGARALQAGLPAVRSCLHTLFIAQACLARDVVPVFVTLPSLPEVSAAETRTAALFVKEMGLNLGGGIVDLYSAEKRDAAMSGLTFQKHFAAPTDISLPTPDNAGRTWIAEHIAETLAPMLQAPGAPPRLDESDN